MTQGLIFIRLEPNCIHFVGMYFNLQHFKAILKIFFGFLSSLWRLLRIYDKPRKVGQQSHLTHWGRVTHICVGKLTIIVSDNGLSPDRRQAIIWTNAGLLSIGPLRTNFGENSIKIQQFSLKKMHVKMSSAKWRPSCLGLNVLRVPYNGVDPVVTVMTCRDDTYRKGLEILLKMNCQ